MPANELEADWAAQRIKNLNLLNAIVNALIPKRNSTGITSLIEEFEYPRHGPGMMWERCCELVQAQGSNVEFNSTVTKIRHTNGVATEVITTGAGGQQVHECSAVISSMPIPRLVQAMDPPAPTEVLRAASGLKFRDFLTVALVVPLEDGFPDNWIYIHSPRSGCRPCAELWFLVTANDSRTWQNMSGP